MKNNIFNTRLISKLCLVFLMIFAASCEKDDNLLSTTKAELLSYGPAGVKHGEDIRFIGRNLDKVTDIEFKGATVPKANFKQHTSELIVLTVPATAERGVVTLKTSQGDIVSKAPIDFDVPFTVTSFSETARPGGTITIKGEFVNWITSVEFSKGTADTNFVSKSLNEIVVKVPMDAQTGKLIFWGAGTEPVNIESETDLVVTLPSVSAITTTPIRPEGNLTIAGLDLDLVKGVKINGVSSVITDFVSHTPTQIVVKLPKEARAGKISLRAHSDVMVESSTEMNVLLPAITSFSPNPIDRGSNVTIVGTNLDLVQGILFKGIEAPVTEYVSRSLTQIVVKFPLTANRGVIALTTVSGVNVESATAIAIVGDVLPLDPVKYAFYEDDYQNNWQNWGWGNTNDPANTDFVRDGDKSLKATFSNSWGAIKFANSEVSTAGYTELTFAIYGGVGTDGKVLSVVPSGSSTYAAVIQEGKWVEYKVKLADIGNPAKISDIMMQETGWAGTIYLDHIGLR